MLLTTRFQKNHRLVVWTIAAGLALMLTIGQPVASQWLGIDWAPAASACQTQSSNGEC